MVFKFLISNFFFCSPPPVKSVIIFGLSPRYFPVKSVYWGQKKQQNFLYILEFFLLFLLGKKKKKEKISKKKTFETKP